METELETIVIVMWILGLVGGLFLFWLILHFDHQRFTDTLDRIGELRKLIYELIGEERNSRFEGDSELRKLIYEQIGEERNWRFEGDSELRKLINERLRQATVGR